MPRLLLTLPYAARIGGVESWFADLVTCLPPLGWDVRAVAVAPDRSGGWAPPAYWSHVIPVGKSWWAVRDFARALRSVIARERPDLVLSYAYDAPLVSGPNIPPGPRVIDVVHTGLPAEIDRAERWHPYFDGLIAVGAGTRDAIDAGLTQVPAAERPPVRVVRHGLRFPPPPPPPAADAGPLHLLWFGRLHRAVKRVFDLIPLCMKLQEAGVRFSLTVLGDGVDAAEFARAVRELPPKTIRLLPAVAPEEVFDILVGHHVFLSTSEGEGGPRTLLEAMSCHIVPIVTDIPGYSQEVVEEGVNGFRVPIGDVAGFADRIARLAGDRHLLATLSVRCRPAVESRFALARMAAELDSFFREVLAAPSRRNLARTDEDMAIFLPDRWRKVPSRLMLCARWAAWTVGALPSASE